MKKCWLVMLCIIGCVVPAKSYYWVGGAGNWSDMNHWALTSGATGGAGVPTAIDDAIFDLNSFSIPGETVTIDIPAFCKSMDWTGSTNAPILAGIQPLIITGSLTFVPAMTVTYTGSIVFNSTNTGNTLTMAAKSLPNIEFNGIGGTWGLQDALVLTNQLLLTAGTLLTNNNSISVNSLNCNGTGDLVRTLDLGSSAVNVSGAGTCIDFRGNTANFTLLSLPASLITCSNTAAMTLQLGGFAKTIPSLIFSSITTNDVTMTTQNVANTITFRNITKSAVGNGRIDIDQGTTNTTFKIFSGNFAMSNSTRLRIGNRNATAWGALPRSRFLGTIGLGTACQFELRGNFTTIEAATNWVGITSFLFQSHIQFLNTLAQSGGTFTGSYPAKLRVDQPMTIGGVTTFNIFDSAYYASVTTLPTSNFTYVTDPNEASVFRDNFIVGSESFFTLGTGSAMPMYFLKDVTLQSEARMVVNILTALFTIRGALNLNSYSIIELNSSSAGTAVDSIGTINASVNCRNWASIFSSTPPYQARIALKNNVAVTGLVCKDLNNISGFTFNVTGGVNAGNNTNITISAAAALNYYWIGGVTGYTNAEKIGAPNSTGNNRNWSNPANWSQASGNKSYASINGCIPSIIDNVNFDDLSYGDPGEDEVEIDLLVTSCASMVWNIATNNAMRFDPTANNGTAILNIAGDLKLDGNGMTNSFEGLWYMTAVSTSGSTINLDGENLVSSIEFDYTGKTWTLSGNMGITLGAASGTKTNLTITGGTLDASTSNYSIDLNGDWTVNTTGANFIPRAGSVTFSGASGDVNISALPAASFYDLIINRNTTTTDVRIRRNDITVQNNLTITRGRLWDSDEANEGPWSITAGGTGTLSIANNGSLFLGDNGGTSGASGGTDNPTPKAATTLPIGFASYSLAGTVDYRQRRSGTAGGPIAQPIVGGVTYANLTLSNANGVKINKYLLSTVTVNPTYLISVTGTFLIGDDNNFSDEGYQVSGSGGSSVLRMSADGGANGAGVYIVGKNASATTLAGYAQIDLQNGSKVIYDATAAQNVAGGSGFDGTGGGAGLRSYARLQVRNASVKTIQTGNIRVRDSLIITSGTLDASASNRAIEQQGHWVNAGGTFVPRNGLVTFNGAALQNVTSGGSDFYNLTINNASNIALIGIAAVQGLCTFTAGDINCAGANSLLFRDNATHVGAGNASHANGTVTKVGDDIFDFPIGTGTIYRPCGIANAPSSILDSYTAYYVPTDPHAIGTPLDPSLDHISFCEHWMISQNAGTSSILIKLSWETSMSCGVADPADLAVAHWDGATWKDQGNSAASPLGAFGTVTASVGVSSFSPFTLADRIGGVINPLPVQLIRFNGFQENDNIRLTWEVQSEKEFGHYEVERSRDGINFSMLSKILPHSLKQPVMQYDYLDQAPPFGELYYRLKMVDGNGSITYSSIITIGRVYSITIYPNPSDGESLYVNFPSIETQDVLLVLQDVYGRVVYEKLVVANSNEEFNIISRPKVLEPGIYFVLASNKNFLLNKKIIIR